MPKFLHPSDFLYPLELGNFIAENNIFYAPLAGCSDFPFRRISSQYNPGLIYCEMVKMDAVIRNDQGTFHMLDFSKDMHPIGAQLCGSKPSIAGKAAQIIEDLGFDVVDLNCGCPVDKITKDGSGSGLMKNPELIGEILANMVAAVKIPVTVKVRAGWDDNSINAPLITKIAEEAGAKAICIHGRTREQGYRGNANWDHIKACVDVADTIKVIGNGDVFDADSALRMFQHTGCDAVLVSRGTLGQPWIVQDIIRLLTDKPPVVHSLEECKRVLYEHFLETLAYQHDRRVAVEMRKVGCWYFKKCSGTKSFRELISRAENVSVVRDLILNFSPSEEPEMQGAQEGGDSCCE